MFVCCLCYVLLLGPLRSFLTPSCLHSSRAPMYPKSLTVDTWNPYSVVGTAKNKTASPKPANNQASVYAKD